MCGQRLENDGRLAFVRRSRALAEAALLSGADGLDALGRDEADAPTVA
jgi:hypothetical protein